MTGRERGAWSDEPHPSSDPWPVWDLRWYDAVVAWSLNAGVPILFAVAALVLVDWRIGDAAHTFLRVLAAGLFILWVSRRGVRWRDVLAIFGTHSRALRVGALVGVGLTLVKFGSVVAWRFVDRTPNLSDGSWVPWLATRSLSGPYLWHFVGLVIVAPVAEELFHRAGAFQALRSRLGWWSSAIISSTVFALGHEREWWTLASGLLSGMVFAWLFERFRSVGPAWAAHVVSNSLVFASEWAAYNVFGLVGTSLA